MRTIRQLVSASCVVAVLALGVPLFVASPSAQSRPKNATAQCKDGTYSAAKTKQGACSKHGGIQTWFADEKASTAPAPTAATKETPKSDSTPKTTGKAPTKAAGGEVPANATAKCRDNTYSFAKQHRGACSHHGGVAEWFK